MFFTYLKTAIRNIRRNPVFSLINIVGLAIGIAVAFVVYFKVQYDLSFNKFIPDENRIYRIISHSQFGSHSSSSAGVPVPLASAIKREATGIEQMVPLRKYYPKNTAIPAPAGQEQKVYNDEGRIVFTNAGYFNLISYQWLAGSPKVLDEPYMIILTEKRARKYFPHAALSHIIGRKITIDTTFTVTIGGIVKDPGKNTGFDFTAFISFNTIPNNHTLKSSLNWDQWRFFSSLFQIVIKLYPNSTPKDIGATLNRISGKYRKEGNMLPDSFSLQPLADIHFNPDLPGIDQAPVSKTGLYSLMAIALFLLLLGAFNFINLTTAQSLLRAKEIGVRKTMGGSRGQLMLQFFTETFVITLLAGLASLILLPYFFKLFSGFFPVVSRFSLGDHNHFFFFFIVLILLITLLSGWYPALLLTRFKPVTVLRNAVVPGGAGKTGLRKVLITLQFIIAQVFVTSTFFMIKQTHFLLNKDLGFNQEAIVYFSIPHGDKTANEQYRQKATALLQKIREMPEIERVSLADEPPSSGGQVQYLLTIKQKQREEKIAAVQINADSDYLKIYRFRLLAGSMDLQSDEDRLINETLQKRLGYKNPAGAIGKSLSGFGTIAGVIADFNDRPLRYKIQPLYISGEFLPGRTFNILLKPQSPGNHVWEHAINKLEKAWSATYPRQEFHLRFLDKTIASRYNNEQRLLKLLYWLTAIAIVISILGLLGLVIYITHQRTKEIGIRKILGASLGHLAYILCKEFVVLVMLATVIAIPVTWILVHKYLQQYAYHTGLSWWIFVLSSVIMLLITLVVMSFRTVRTARANPADALRSE